MLTRDLLAGNPKAAAPLRTRGFSRLSRVAAGKTVTAGSFPSMDFLPSRGNLRARPDWHRVNISGNCLEGAWAPCRTRDACTVSVTLPRQVPRQFARRAERHDRR